MAVHKVLVLNGANLDMLGVREPDYYGSATLDALERTVEHYARERGIKVDCFQSNSEARLIDKIHRARDVYDAIVFNPAAHTHYSYALRDAVASIDLPVIEVHLTDIDERESFRHTSVIAPACVAQIKGRGVKGYCNAIDLLNLYETFGRLGEGYEKRYAPSQIIIAGYTELSVEAASPSLGDVPGASPDVAPGTAPVVITPKAGGLAHAPGEELVGDPALANVGRDELDEGDDDGQAALWQSATQAVWSNEADGSPNAGGEAAPGAVDAVDRMGAVESCGVAGAAPASEAAFAPMVADDGSAASCDSVHAGPFAGVASEGALSSVRVERLRSAFEDAGVDAFLARGTSHIRWLTALDDVFDEEQAHALLVTPERVVLHTDGRYANAARAAAADIGASLEVDERRASHGAFARAVLLGGAVCASGEAAIAQASLDDATQADKAAVADAGCTSRAAAASDRAGAHSVRLGIEADVLTLAEYRRLDQELSDAQDDPDASDVERPRIAVVETTGAVEKLRAVKDAAELQRMRAAQAILDEAFDHIITFMKPGMTERAVQIELEDFMIRHGAQGLAFPSIVASGPNGANPHAVPGGKLLAAGECVVLDFGARALGYCSDMTRTVFLGAPDPQMRAAWECVRCANEEAAQLIAPGVSGALVHARAEEVLAQGGFGGKMGHSLGHGVGIDVHEQPLLSPRNDSPLEVGNVVTVEPGIYVSGAFGMRLEDCGVVTDEGYERFGRSTHEMVIL